MMGMGETEVPCFVQYIEEPVNSLEDGLTFYQETGVPIALDESLDHAMRQVSRHSRTLPSRITWCPVLPERLRHDWTACACSVLSAAWLATSGNESWLLAASLEGQQTRFVSAKAPVNAGRACFPAGCAGERWRGCGSGEAGRCGRL